MTPDLVVFSRRTDAPDESTTPSSHALALTFRDDQAGCPYFVKSQATHLIRTNSHGVSYPSTHEESSSDLHRVYLARLCYAFRLSQPLDALFRPNPFSPCFMRVAPLGFQLSEVFPLQQREELHSLPSLHAVYHRDLPRRQADPLSTTPQLQGFAPSKNPYRRTRCYPTDADRSSLSFAPLRGFHLSDLDPVLPQDLLSWAFHVSLDGKPPISTYALQSFKEPESRLASFENCQPP
jgi:hypothetical protein